MIEKVKKKSAPWAYIIEGLNSEESFGTSYRNKSQKINKQFRVEKVSKYKGYKLYKKWKVYDNSFNSCMDKNSRNKVKVKLHLSNYAIKSDLKGTTATDTSKFVKTADLSSLKSDFDKLHYKLLLLI